jgi:hypothetical protein
MGQEIRLNLSGFNKCVDSEFDKSMLALRACRRMKMPLYTLQGLAGIPGIFRLRLRQIVRILELSQWWSIAVMAIHIS